MTRMLYFSEPNLVLNTSLDPAISDKTVDAHVSHPSYASEKRLFYECRHFRPSLLLGRIFLLEA